MRKKLKGSTDVNSRRETGLLIRELQGMMINSVLSGPKTPLRALWVHLLLLLQNR